MRKPTRAGKTSVAWTIHLDVMEHAFILIGLQSVRWGGDPRVEPLFNKMYDKLRERASDILDDLVIRGDVQAIDPPELRKAKAGVSELLASEPPAVPEPEPPASYVGWWYASGPAGREFSPEDPEFNVHRVVSDTSEVPGAVTIENGGGQRFPLERSLLAKIASPPRSS